MRKKSRALFQGEKAGFSTMAHSYIFSVDLLDHGQTCHRQIQLCVNVKKKTY